MKYDEEKFNSAVNDYKKILNNSKNKSFFFVFDIKNKNAFYSLAPLSRALHDSGADVSCIGIKGKSESFDSLRDVWETFESKKINENTSALKDFIKEVDKKAKNEFEKIFKKPDFLFQSGEKQFNGMINLPFHTEWFHDYRMEELMETSEILWRDVYDLKKNERVGIGFSLIPTDKLIGHPLEDYLDSYSIIWAMTTTAARIAEPTMSAYTFRASMLERGERTSDLRATLLGCELDKEIDEEPFVKFKKLSKFLKLDRIKPIDLSFSVSPKGYPGKHLFGEVIGYPSLN